MSTENDKKDQPQSLAKILNESLWAQIREIQKRDPQIALALATQLTLYGQYLQATLIEIFKVAEDREQQLRADTTESLHDLADYVRDETDRKIDPQIDKLNSIADRHTDWIWELKDKLEPPNPSTKS